MFALRTILGYGSIMIPMQYSDRWKALLRQLMASSSPAERDTEQLGQQLRALSKQLAQPGSPVFEREARMRLRTVGKTLEELNAETLSFKCTETWRSIYEEVLANCRSKRYLSVALINSDGYWRDQPGQCSLQFNYRLVKASYFVHRLFIIDDYFWPPAARLPENDLMRWIHQQYDQGIEISLVRVSELQLEPDLIADFGVYGDEAVGYQQTDQDGRTQRYELHFDATRVAAAEQRWNKLQLFSLRLETILDRDVQSG
jgi:hypothetical protein